MIYSENAPELEGVLHEFLDHRRVNLVNLRKEFFEATLEDIDAFAKQRGLSVQLTKLAEAREYRETLSLRPQQAAPAKDSTDKFPHALFGDTAPVTMAAKAGA